MRNKDCITSDWSLLALSACTVDLRSFLSRCGCFLWCAHEVCDLGGAGSLSALVMNYLSILSDLLTVNDHALFLPIITLDS